MKLGGVAETDLYRDALDTMKRRFWWLFVNLTTAVIASIAIGFFDATIDQIVALAVLMPIVASMGGNAGTQTLTVAVRALAVRDLSPDTAWRFIGKEFIVGFVNGILFAILTGLIAWLWFRNAELGAVIAAAMICSRLGQSLFSRRKPRAHPLTGEFAAKVSLRRSGVARAPDLVILGKGEPTVPTDPGGRDAGNQETLRQSIMVSVQRLA